MATAAVTAYTPTAYAVTDTTSRPAVLVNIHSTAAVTRMTTPPMVRRWNGVTWAVVSQPKS